MISGRKDVSENRIETLTRPREARSARIIRSIGNWLGDVLADEPRAFANALAPFRFLEKACLIMMHSLSFRTHVVITSRICLIGRTRVNSLSTILLLINFEFVYYCAPACYATYIIYN